MSFEKNESLNYRESLQLQVGLATNKLRNILEGPLASADPALKPLSEQIINHLNHVTYDFRISPTSIETYPYVLRGRHAYETAPTMRALQKAERFTSLLTEETTPAVEFPILPEAYKKEALVQQQAIVQNLLENPVETEADMMSRRTEHGPEAPFPELGWTLKGLLFDLINKQSVQEACEKSQVLTSLRAKLIDAVMAKIEEGTFGYESSLFLIEDTVAFFDVVVRTLNPNTPRTYHSARFEYNWHSLSEDATHTVLPTMASVTSLDLLKMRCIPVGLIGVFTDTMTVDGFPQTPYEFFHHDVDHTRRMHEETTLGIERDGVTAAQFAKDAHELVNKTLIPNLDLVGIDDQIERDKRIAMRMILFEILHEDAYDPTADSIADAILRQPLEHTPFEQLTGSTVEYFTGPRASTLAHVYRKLAHTFYDDPESRSSSLGTDFVRTRLAIADAAASLYRLVSDDPVEDSALLDTCRALVSTDEGFTDAFIGNIAHDITRRSVGEKTLALMIIKPQGVSAAVRSARMGGKKIHSLFGYSALEYEEPELLQATVEKDLSELDPEEYTIAIGVTPYGIGAMYPVAKELGFTTLGIVAAKALGKNERCADGVDRVIVVKDQGWGGQRYSENSSGLLSPTTRVFVGASDSIAAYGGGGITAVTINEALRRGKPVTFKPFEMNHRIADMNRGQIGQEAQQDYRGPAYHAWQKILSAKK